MAIHRSLVVVSAVVVLVNLLARTESAKPSLISYFNRTSFPDDFVFGTASSAYQYEGAANVGGKGLSNWDYFTHKYPERIDDSSNGDVAIDFYHRFPGDVQIMKKMGMDAFRLSISWTRILPTGKLADGVNEDGVKFYKALIHELRTNGLEPYVTIFHWDVPQALEKEYGGFLRHRIVDDFRDFAQVCFEKFGDKVKYWITINEPWTFSSSGYDTGVFAPGRCSKFMNSACQAGNSGIEPYLVTHHMLLAHAEAVKLYRENYQASQNGKIGMTMNSHWFVPYSTSAADVKAAKRALDFMFGWYMDPLVYGRYPESMRKLVKKRLPTFTKEQSEKVKGSYDFIGINYYTGYYAADVPLVNPVNKSLSTDSQANLTKERNGKLIGPQAASSWLNVYPVGFYKLLTHTKEVYKNPVIYVTENGVDEFNNESLSLSEARKDPMRINYYYRHLLRLKQAMDDGVDVKGYFPWSLFDNFEWNSGYTVRFGLNYVNYTDLKRYPKQSAYWVKKFLLK